MYQRTFKKFTQFVLSSPPSGTSLTCYVDVIQPNGVSATYYQAVTVNPTSLSVSDFNTQVAKAVMDDLIESMQMKVKLASLGSSMTTSEKSTALKKILVGL